ncbi:hypothetical protein [Micromonospora sp. NPDC003241]
MQNAEQFAPQEYKTDARLANSMTMAGYGRRTDFAVMKSAGGTRRQVLGFAAAETGTCPAG